MGVSGSGKSTIAAQVANDFDYDYIDADDFHSDEAKAKMSASEPLTDELRNEWMQRLTLFLSKESQQDKPLVLAHSCLKKVHRNMLRTVGFQCHFFFLDGSEALISERMKNRNGHFFPMSLLRSQFQALEHPKLSQRVREELDISLVNIEQSPAAIISQIEQKVMALITS